MPWMGRDRDRLPRTILMIRTRTPARLLRRLLASRFHLREILSPGGRRPRASLTAFLAVLVTAGCTTSGALETRVKDLERQVADLQKATADLSSKVDEVSNGLFILKDRVEAQIATLESLRKQPPVKAPRATKADDIPQIYKRALALFNSQEYEKGLKEFEKVLQDNPRHALAGNARYWRGECFFALKDYEKSLTELQKVLEDYPKHNKVPDALLKIGLVYVQLGDKQQAVEYMERVIREYPYSEASKRAEVKLKEITQQ